MRGLWLGAVGVLVLGVACGSALDASGANQQTGGAGGSGPDGGGGSGGVVPGTLPDVPTGQTGDASSGGTGALGALELDCASIASDPHVSTSTIAGNNASGSAVEARETLSAEVPGAPVPAHVSVQEFLNYYRPTFPELTGPDPAVHIQLRHNGVPKHFDLMVALQAPRAQSRPRAVLTLAIDNSLSMGAGLERARSALRAIASELVAGDSVQWLSVGPETTPVAFAISGANDGPLLEAVEGLQLAPERELSVLIEAAYEVAGASFDASAMNRVLLVSDGTDHPATLPSVITSRAEAGAGSEIRMSVLGTGSARENGHRTLRAASRFGRGAYRYLDEVDTAPANVPGFDELFGVALDDVKLELTLPWYFTVERPFLGAVVDSNAPIEPQYLAPGGTMTFLFRLIACSETAYGDVSADAPTIEARLSWLSPSDGSAGEVIEGALPATLADQTPSAELTQLLAVASYADALHSLDKKRLTHAITLLEGAQLSEIAQLLGKHPVLTAP